MTYQTLTCPNCHGSGQSADGRGCPTCQGTGKVRVSSAEMQKLKTMLGQFDQTPPQPEIERPLAEPPKPSQANLAGIIAFTLLSLLAGGAAASWYFLKTLKPFFAGLISLLALLAGRFALNREFFKLQEPDDFLTAIKKLSNAD